MKKNIRYFEIILLLFFVLLCSLFSYKYSYGVYSQNLSTTVNLTIVDPSTLYDIEFDNGDGDPLTNTHYYKTLNSALGTLPTETKAGYNFAGWYTDDVNYTTKINAKNKVSGDVTYYAKWVKIVCKKATTLHEEKCRTGGGCLQNNNLNDPLQYGTIPVNSVPQGGYAYDCDVNNNNYFDASTERFYFTRAITDGISTGENSAALVHFTSFDNQGQMDSDKGRGSYTYAAGKDWLPDSTLWSNPALKAFDGKVSRYMTLADIAGGCNSPVVLNDSSYLGSCEFFVENSRYQGSDYGRAGIWIDMEATTYYRIQSQTSVIQVPDKGASSDNTVRPVIEIPINAIEDYPDKDLYTISFETGEGSHVADVQRAENEAIGELPTPTRSGYTFGGWYSDDEYTTLVTSATVMPDDNITLYAYWELVGDNMDYVFHVDGTCVFHGAPDLQNNNPNYITSPNNSCIGVDKNNVSTNYTASGNERNYIDTGVALFNQDNFDKDFEIGFTIDSFIYNDQDDTKATILNSKLENSSLNYPGFVVRTEPGIGSKVRLSGRFGVGEPIINNDFTYSAGMKIRIARLNGKLYYAKDNDDLTELVDISEFSQKFNLNTWFGAISLTSSTSSNGVGTSAGRYVKATLSNMYIKLERDSSASTHQVQFYTEGGTLDMSSTRTVADNAVVGPLPTVTRAHYTFNGWYEENGSVPITSNYVITDDITFYAHFTPDSQTVTFDNKGGTPSSTTMTVDFNESLGSLPSAPTKDHNTFAGWYTDDENWTEQVTTQTLITGNVTFYAKWIPDPHTISFNTNNGTPVPSSYTRGYGENIGPLPTNITKSGYVFEGWFRDSGLNIQVFDDTPVWGDATLYAKWGEGLLISFNTQDGSYVAPVRREYGDELGQITEPTKTYFIFAGWYADSDYTIPVDENTIMYQETTLYALWTLDPIYVAQIGNDYYETLADAVSAVTTSTPTNIILLKDITTSAAVTIPANRDITLDIGNNTITNASTNTFIVNGTLRIHDGLIKETAGQGAINVEVGGNLYVTGGTIHNSSSRQAIYNKGNLYISGTALLKTAATHRGAVDNDDSSAYIEMTGGTIESTNANSRTGALRIVSGTANITGGTIISASTSATASEKGDYSAAIYNKGNLTIGTQNNTYDATTPVIQGKRYAVYSTVNYKVYDGILKGKIDSVNDLSLIPSANTEPNTNPVTTDTEVIGTDTYKLLYYELASGYRVDLDPGTGGSVTPTYKIVAEDTAVGQLPTPEKTGYVFNGWYTTGGQLVTTATVVTQDTTYTAHWVESVLNANLNNNSLVLLKNGTSTISVSNSNDLEPYTYSSNNSSIATVSSNGVITAVNPGITQISLTGDLSGDIKHVLVTVNYANDIETFDIMPTPMRTYFNNIDIWAKGQTDSNHASYDSYMNSNLSTNNCINFDGDNRQNKSNATGSVYCDLPNHYQTGVSGNLYVYEYNPDTNTNIRSASYVTVNNGEIYNLIPGKTYYWESVNDPTDHGKFYAFGERRIIEINNLKNGSNDTYFQTRNVRDLGGIPVTYENSSNETVTGIIKYEKLYRGEKIWGGYTNSDSLQYFTHLGINHEMDLRANNEPVSNEEDSFADAYKIRSASKTYEIIHYGIDYTANSSNYAIARAAVVEVMNAFINDNTYSLYFHCRIGADRTGTLAYLLEGLLGVSEEDRYRDYEMTVFFGLDERTRFYYNKGDNTTKFIYMKQAIRNASTNGDEEDVVAWFLKGSSNVSADMSLIQDFRTAMIDVISVN